MAVDVDDICHYGDWYCNSVLSSWKLHRFDAIAIELFPMACRYLVELLRFDTRREDVVYT